MSRKATPVDTTDSNRNSLHSRCHCQISLGNYVMIKFVYTKGRDFLLLEINATVTYNRSGTKRPHLLPWI